VSGHAPGPWRTDGVVVWASDNGGQSFDVPVCVMTSRHENLLTHPASNAPTCGLENADLIAASPDLLESLRYAVAQVPDLGTVPGIAASIAKAEGR
jgi:hypothetical protein